MIYIDSKENVINLCNNFGVKHTVVMIRFCETNTKFKGEDFNVEAKSYFSKNRDLGDFNLSGHFN